MELPKDYETHLRRRVGKMRRGTCSFHERIDKTVLETLRTSFRPVPAGSYTRPVEILNHSGQAVRVSARPGARPAGEHERFLTEKHSSSRLFRTGLSADDQAVLHARERRRRTVRAMDVLVPKVGEIIGGSQREERLDVLETRMKEQGLVRRVTGGISICGVTARAARRFWVGPGARAPIHHRHGQHSAT